MTVRVNNVKHDKTKKVVMEVQHNVRPWDSKGMHNEGKRNDNGRSRQSSEPWKDFKKERRDLLKQHECLGAGAGGPYICYQDGLRLESRQPSVMSLETYRSPITISVLRKPPREQDRNDHLPNLSVEDFITSTCRAWSSPYGKNRSYRPAVYVANSFVIHYI